jgi:hypothetical protein
VIIVAGSKPLECFRVMPYQNGSHLFGDRRLPSIVFAQTVRRASLPQGQLLGVDTVNSLPGKAR